MPDWDEIGRIGQEDQVDAGFRAIVRNLGQFRDLCLDEGFSTEQSFTLTHEMFVHFMARYDEVEQEEEE